MRQPTLLPPPPPPPSPRKRHQQDSVFRVTSRFSTKSSFEDTLHLNVKAKDFLEKLIYFKLRYHILLL